MTPQEQRLMLEMIRQVANEALKGAIVEALIPIEKRLEELETTDKKLAADDRKLSGQHKLVVTQTLPQLATNLQLERTEDMKAFSLAFNRLVQYVGGIAENQARMEARANLALVQVPDGKGGTSIRPASMLAAESAQRTEGKIDAAAVDQEQTAKNVAEVSKRTKFWLPIAGAVPVLVEIGKVVWPMIHH